jgi:hypothetical protein
VPKMGQSGGEVSPLFSVKNQSILEELEVPDPEAVAALSQGGGFRPGAEHPLTHETSLVYATLTTSNLAVYSPEPGGWRTSMFEEFIAQGNDMIRRQKRQVGMPSHWVEEIPESERVSLIEATAWRREIEERIRNRFGVDAYARYNIFWDIFKDDIEKGKGDESARYVTVLQRIVAYLTELDGRLAARNNTTKEDGDTETRKIG